MKPSSDTPVVPREPTVRKRLSRCFIIFLLGNAIVFVGYRSCVWHAQWAISRIGGQTVTDPPPVYFDLAYSTKMPANIRPWFTSRFGHWLFSQFPVIYAVDLRGVSDPDAVAEALQIATGLDHVTELVLYRSAVRDEHLGIVARGFPRLRSLKINETLIGDSGIAHLSGNTTLVHLNVHRTAVTNSCVQSICGMPRLKELNVAETRITSLEQLRKANPACYITTTLVTRVQTTDKQRSLNRLRYLFTPASAM